MGRDSTRNRLAPRRVPHFTPVPLRYRSDGWTPARQADFLGYLAETGSVPAAARRVGMSRESAYRLRIKPGAESFAAAWDRIAGRHAPRKVTGARLLERARAGRLQPILRQGCYVGTLLSPDNDAVLRLYRRAMRERRNERDRMRRLRR
jgi:hypothetical protein